jgi:hypothetical protein
LYLVYDRSRVLLGVMTLLGAVSFALGVVGSVASARAPHFTSFYTIDRARLDAWERGAGGKRLFVAQYAVELGVDVVVFGGMAVAAAVRSPAVRSERRREEGTTATTTRLSRTLRWLAETMVSPLAFPPSMRWSGSGPH